MDNNYVHFFPQETRFCGTTEEIRVTLNADLVTCPDCLIKSRKDRERLLKELESLDEEPK